MMNKNLKIVAFTDDQVMDLIPEIAALRIDVFAEYPFLYVGDLEYEKRYLKKFISMDDAIVVAAFDEKTIVGISTAYPFQYESEYLTNVFIESGLSPQDYYCFGESVLKKQYRGQGIGKAFFAERENFARSLQKFSHLCFYTSIRPLDDPKKPLDYRPLDPFWKAQGFQKHPNLIGMVSYQEIGSAVETPHPMVFWTKKL
jgi:GNAT superfamily N-acetyltransferase